MMQDLIIDNFQIEGVCGLSVLKGRRRMRVYYNGSTDTWSDDAKEQLSLTPDASDYGVVPESDMMKNVLENHTETGNVNEAVRRDADSDRDEFVQSDDVDGFMEYAYKNAVYRSHIKQNKFSQNKWIQKIVSRGLGKRVSISGGISCSMGLPGISNSGELYNDAVTVSDYARDVISGYKKPFEKAVRNLPVIADGGHNTEACEICPGMRTMVKYM